MRCNEPASLRKACSPKKLIRDALSSFAIVAGIGAPQANAATGGIRPIEGSNEKAAGRRLGISRYQVDAHLRKHLCGPSDVCLGKPIHIRGHDQCVGFLKSI